ncbi:hypothetical protein [Methanobrevibacter sp.]|uniref:hypothetical protein n=1 Tax=Methanobrevibacter sp. TaxID=66852 RepID=UPI0025D6F31E|nr:hypothetical protein [Methanobrevibacter sp.]MBQ6512990.1 hypothetical protein [Methanobrevibacter sp.]
MSEEKIETCFICGKEFDMNKADLGYYRNGQFPICDFCADFYRFYNEDIPTKKE